MKEYELTLVYRAEDDDDAEEIARMIEAVLRQLDHPVAVAGPCSSQSPPSTLPTSRHQVWATVPE